MTSLIEDQQQQSTRSGNWHHWQGEYVVNDRKISGGVYAVTLSKNHCYRRIRSCRRELALHKPGDNRFRIAHKTADLSMDELVGVYCSRCFNLIYVGANCYKKKRGRGRSSYYHSECAEIVHLV